MEKESLESKYNEKQQKLLNEGKDAKKKIDTLIKVNAMICYAMRCDAMRCDAMRCDAMPCHAMRYDMI